MTPKMWRHRITAAGQVSIPAEVRDRWRAQTVAIEDRGDRIVLRPVPDDPIDALQGVLAAYATGASSTAAVRRLRDEDVEVGEAKWPRRPAR